MAGTKAADLVSKIVPPGVSRLIRVRDAWARAARGPALRRTWPAAVRGDELIVHVHDNQWLHELTYQKNQLLADLQSLVPEAGIARLRFCVGAVLPPPPPPDPESKRPAPPRLAADPPAETMRAMSEVCDGELKNLIAIARYNLGREPHS